MSDSPINSSNEDIPEEWRYKPDLNLYCAYLSYLEDQGLEDWENITVIAFAMADGTYRFSAFDPLDALLKISEESIFSDRLFVIVSVAYLEDQIRLLLAKFLADDEIARRLLDPTDGPLASIVQMANLAYSMGLLAKEWLEILKRMARLRNVFAHVATARTFNDVLAVEPKAKSIMDSLTERSKQFIEIASEDEQNFKDIYSQVFLAMYNLTQFAIDHIAIPAARRPYNGGQIMQMKTIMGFSKEDIEQLIRSSEKEE